MRTSLAAALLLFTLTMSDGYPSLRIIKEELERLKLFRPPQTTTATPPTLPSAAALAIPTALTATTPPAMVAGFLGRLSYPDAGYHVMWPGKLVQKTSKPPNP